MRGTTRDTRARSSTVSGNSVDLVAGNDTNIKSSNVVSNNNVNLSAYNDNNTTAAKQTATRDRVLL